MKKIILFLLTAFFVVGCTDQIDITGPNGSNNNNNNNNNNNGVVLILQNWNSSLICGGPPELIDVRSLGGTRCEYTFRKSLYHFPQNPSPLISARFSIPRVVNGVTVYTNQEHSVQFGSVYFTPISPGSNISDGFVYFKGTCDIGDYILFNVAIGSNTGIWSYVVYPDDGVHNMYGLTAPPPGKSFGKEIFKLEISPEKRKELKEKGIKIPEQI